MMFPINARAPEAEHVLIFDGVHVVANVMTDLCLQFSDESLKHAHLDGGQEPRLFQGVDVP